MAALLNIPRKQILKATSLVGGRLTLQEEKKINFTRSQPMFQTVCGRKNPEV